MNYHVGLRHQRGRGLGSFFSSLIRGLIPVAKFGFQTGKKLINTDLGQKLTKKALEQAKASALSLSTDLLEGKNMKESAQRELNNVKQQLATTLKGGSRKRRKSAVHIKNFSKKRKINFNLLDND